jgi:hypothetical protein
MPSPRDAPEKKRKKQQPPPVVRFELEIILSAPRPVLENIAKADGRVRITDGRAELSVRSGSPSEAIAELKQLADGIKKTINRAGSVNSSAHNRRFE